MLIRAPSSWVKRVAADSSVGVGVRQACVRAQRRGDDKMGEEDSGHHCSGVPAADASRAAGLDVARVLTFPGLRYVPAGRPAAINGEARTLATAVASLAGVGITARVVRGSSTPSAEFAGADFLTEIYMFRDGQQWELGASLSEGIVLTSCSTVAFQRDGTSSPTPAAWSLAWIMLLTHLDGAVAGVTRGSDYIRVGTPRHVQRSWTPCRYSRKRGTQPSARTPSTSSITTLSPGQGGDG